MASAQIVLPVPGGPAKLNASARPVGCRSPKPQRLKIEIVLRHLRERHVERSPCRRRQDDVVERAARRDRLDRATAGLCRTDERRELAPHFHRTASGAHNQRRSVARNGWIDEHRPGVDAAAKIVEIPEPVLSEVFSGLLAADAMVALEHDRRVPIPLEQLVVVPLSSKAKAVDRGRLRSHSVRMSTRSIVVSLSSIAFKSGADS